MENEEHSIIISEKRQTNEIGFTITQASFLQVNTGMWHGTRWTCMISRFKLGLTFCNPMNCSPAGSSVYGILQARILEWVAMPSSRGYSWLRNQTWAHISPTLAGGFFTISTTREADGARRGASNKYPATVLKWKEEEKIKERSRKLEFIG